MFSTHVDISNTPTPRIIYFIHIYFRHATIYSSTMYVQCTCTYSRGIIIIVGVWNVCCLNDNCLGEAINLKCSIYFYDFFCFLYFNCSCWIEIKNMFAACVQISFYVLKTFFYNICFVLYGYFKIDECLASVTNEQKVLNINIYA